MKKVLALVLALVMVFALSAVAFAEEPQINVSGESGKAVTVEVKSGSDTAAKVYSVAIAWGTMDFTYEYYQWDDASHAYIGGWVTEDGHDASITTDITVTNHSNAQVNVKAAYSTEGKTTVEGVTAELTNDGVAQTLHSAVGTDKGAAPCVTYTLTVSGAPKNEKLDKVEIGTITITISAVTTTEAGGETGE